MKKTISSHGSAGKLVLNYVDQLKIFCKDELRYYSRNTVSKLSIILHTQDNLDEKRKGNDHKSSIIDLLSNTNKKMGW